MEIAGPSEPSSKLHEDLGMMRLDLQPTNSFLDELEGIDPSGTFGEQGISSHMFMSKPCKYLSCISSTLAV